MVCGVVHTTPVGHCLQKMLLFDFEGHRFLLTIKRNPSSLSTMFRMVLIAVVLAS